MPSRLKSILSTEISLAELTLLEVSVPHVEPFQSAIGKRDDRLALLVHWTDDDGDWGIGECGCRPDPFYSGEFVSGAAEVIQEFVFPSLPAKGTMQDVVQVTSRLRGWNFAQAAVLDAVFDMLRRKGTGDVIDQALPRRLDRVPVGIALGLFRNAEEAVARVAKAVGEGYRRVKFKVAPWMDMDTMHAVRSTFPTLRITFDANGSFGQDDIDVLAQLVSCDPQWIEQPFPPDRLDWHADVRKRLPDAKICLDESVDSVGHLVSAHRMRAIDVLNLKPGRVGGMLESLEILAYCDEQDIPVWIGGMFETGIGRANNLRYAARLPNSLEHDLSPSKRYFKTDLVESPVEMDNDGYVHVGDEAPVTLRDAVIDSLCLSRTVLIK